ncbi:MAG: radical SAM protein [Candidatus Omnitrophica bacterium]|nr:radical SAM protein [Candidatus Omnitrophota bacterium]
MANILFIDAPWYVLQNINSYKPSYGLASIAGVLRKGGHNCLIYNGEFGMPTVSSYDEKIIIDADLYRSNLKDDSLIWKKTWKNISQIINNFAPAIIGITIPTAKYSIAIKIANQIKKEFSNMTIVAGGPHPTIESAGIIEEASIDAAVRGEGELAFLELAEAIENGASIDNVKGIVTKSNSGTSCGPDRPHITDIDNIPFPAWDLVYNFDKHPPDSFGAVFSSRGCPYKCIFCASFKLWTRKVRYMSPERVVAELQYTSQRYKTKYFRFNDDTFILDEHRVIEICEGIKKANLKIKWECDIRADTCSYEILKIIKSAGCVKVNIGIESGSADILKRIKKNITLEDIDRAFIAIRKAGLIALAYFMVGFPFETIEQVNDTIKLMWKLRPDYSCWSIATPYPGTELYEMASQGGFLNSKPDWGGLFHHSSETYMSRHINYGMFLKLIRKIEARRKMLDLRRALRSALCRPSEFYCSVQRRIQELTVGYGGSAI